MKTSRWATYFAGLIFLVASGATGAEEAVASNLPKEVAPLPPELNRRMGELLKAAEKYRGLLSTQPVPSGALGEEALRGKMLEAFHEELPPAKMDPLETALKTFGFIPASMALGKYFPELLTSQVGGFYDPKRKYLVLVQREGGLLGPEAKKQYGEALARRMEETVLVHELTHALQDQHFNLQKLLIEDPLSDAGAARTALVEGDATLTMYDFFSGMNLEDLPGMEGLVSDLLKDPRQLMEMSPDMPGAKEMENAPAWFRDTLLFSYLRGFVFCLNVKKHGGQKLLDYAFAKDPPRSTAQILHPEKWYGQRDDPVEIAWPDLAQALPGYTKVSEGQLGELGIRILLSAALKDEQKAAEAAAGWGGDRFAVYEKNGQRVLLWVTEWDSVHDSRRFKTACAALGENWHVTASRPTRVQLVKGNVDAAALAAVGDVLAAAHADVPANQPIDLAALNINVKEGKNDDLLSGLLKDPKLQKMAAEMFKNGDEKDLKLDELLKDPKLQKLASELATDGKDSPLGGMLKNPEMQQMLMQMMTQERPAGKTSADGNSYTNDELGFSIKLPTAEKDWTLNAKPSIPMASVLLSTAQDRVQVFVVSQQLPLPLSIEALGPMLEMGPQMSTQGYKKLSAGVIKTGAQPGYEVQFTGTVAGQAMRMTQRYYMQNKRMLVVTATAPQDAWAPHEPAITETLNSLSFSAPKPAPEK